MVDDPPKGTQLEGAELGFELGLSSSAWRSQQRAED